MQLFFWDKKQNQLIKQIRLDLFADCFTRIKILPPYIEAKTSFFGSGRNQSNELISF